VPATCLGIAAIGSAHAIGGAAKTLSRSDADRAGQVDA
jgi:hypothetical protein